MNKILKLFFIIFILMLCFLKVNAQTSDAQEISIKQDAQTREWIVENSGASDAIVIVDYYDEVTIPEKLYLYTGEEITPSPVKADGEDLEETEYSYKDNIEIGEAAVKVLNNGGGTFDINFSIVEGLFEAEYGAESSKTTKKFATLTDALDEENYINETGSYPNEVTLTQKGSYTADDECEISGDNINYFEITLGNTDGSAKLDIKNTTVIISGDNEKTDLTADFKIKENGNLTIKGGNYTTDENYCIKNDGGKLTVSDGSFSGMTAAIYNTQSDNILTDGNAFYDENGNMMYYKKDGVIIFEKFSEGILVDNDAKALKKVFIKKISPIVEPNPVIAGKNANIKLEILYAGNETFTFENQEGIFVNYKSGQYYLTTSSNVSEQSCTIKATNAATKFRVNVIDPFEDFYDSEDWSNKDVVLTYPTNTYNWELNTPDFSDGTITDEGENEVKCQILDQEKNIIAQTDILVKIDKTPPEVSAKVKNTEKSYDIPFEDYLAGNYFLRSGYNAIVESSDKLSGVSEIEYSFDKTNFINYDDTPIELPNGRNMLFLRAKDLAGNTSEIYTSEFSVFQDSKFAENLENEITSDSIFYSSESISDMSFKINLNGNTIGIITDTVNNVLNFPITDNNVINIGKEYLETLTPGDNKLLVHINPLGLAEAWDQNLNPADFESQIMTINLDVEFVVKPSGKYNFVLETDTAIKAFCQNDNVFMTFEFDKAYSIADYVSIETLGIDKENPQDGIKFTVPQDALTGGNEKLPITFFKNDYEYQDIVIFPADYPSDRNIRLYDDVLALDNSDDQFVSDAYKWYMDGKEIQGENKQFIDLLPYLSNKEEHFFYASVLNIEGDRFRVCPDDDFIITPISKKKAVKIKTYPNPAQSGHDFYISLENFAKESFSETEILIFNQLGSLTERITEVQKENSVVLSKGFYSGVVVLRGQKVLNFKIIVE
ncbi:MAG: hypothetical protein II937_13210 [Bacteroidales bacterium]|nr:hypothetical protein [Bacteroidales bacterium]